MKSPGQALSPRSARTPSTIKDLGSLAQAGSHHHDLDLPPDAARFVATLEQMILIRLAEERIADAVVEGHIRCPAHLAIGQEAPPVGVSLHLRNTDRVFGAHRSHGHFLALTSDLHGLFAETLGKDTGVSRGMGGSMHLMARASGFYGSVPIVGATIPIAVGAGLAARMDGKGDIAVSYFGDGATEEGSFHESLNLAVVLRAPVLFLCENNLFSSHLHIDLRQPRDSTCRFAEANDIPFERVDGNDVVEISKAAGEAIRAMREGAGPRFIECVTYRWRGHVGPREDEDVGVKRKDDLTVWKRRDPIARLASALVKAGHLRAAEVDEMKAKTAGRVKSAWEQAMRDPYPDVAALTARTWSQGAAAK